MLEVFLVFLRLGVSAFGGPVAHLGYFREECVTRRGWLSERDYSDLVALCQFLPGPASSQLGIALGLVRHGYLGAVAAWAGFTLPSAVALILLAISLRAQSGAISGGVLQGLKVVAVSVVAQAVWGMGKRFCQKTSHLAVMAGSSCLALWLPPAFGHPTIIAAAGLIGLLWFTPDPRDEKHGTMIRSSRSLGIAFLLLFVGLLFGLPWIHGLQGSQTVAQINAFYRSGALVFGGGHVVLPLLQASVIPQGFVSEETFLAGYAAAQAVPGPLFTFAAFLGASMSHAPNGWAGGFLCLIAIFTPAFLLVLGALPFWARLRQNQKMQAALEGINPAVVGILLAALYHPAWTSAITRPQDFALALVAFFALVVWQTPPWLVVISCAATGWFFSVCPAP